MASPDSGFLSLLLEALQEWLAGLLSMKPSQGQPAPETGKPAPPTTPPQNNPLPAPPSGGSGPREQRVVAGGRINPNARFYSTGSSAWRNQFPGTPMAGKHGGLDILGNEGSAVYAPYPMKVAVVGWYDDHCQGAPCNRYGGYLIGYLRDDPTVQWYSGHLADIQVSQGSSIEGGTLIGYTNLFNHTHLQLKRANVLIDPEKYLTEH